MIRKNLIISLVSCLKTAAGQHESSEESKESVTVIVESIGIEREIQELCLSLDEVDGEKL